MVCTYHCVGNKRYIFPVHLLIVLLYAEQCFHSLCHNYIMIDFIEVDMMIFLSEKVNIIFKGI